MGYREGDAKRSGVRGVKWEEAQRSRGMRDPKDGDSEDLGLAPDAESHGGY